MGLEVEGVAGPSTKLSSQWLLHFCVLTLLLVVVILNSLLRLCGKQKTGKTPGVTYIDVCFGEEEGGLFFKLN